MNSLIIRSYSKSYFKNLTQKGKKLIYHYHNAKKSLAKIFSWIWYEWKEKIESSIYYLFFLIKFLHTRWKPQKQCHHKCINTKFNMAPTVLGIEVSGTGKEAPTRNTLSPSPSPGMLMALLLHQWTLILKNITMCFKILTGWDSGTWIKKLRHRLQYLRNIISCKSCRPFQFQLKHRNVTRETSIFWRIYKIYNEQIANYIEENGSVKSFNPFTSWNKHSLNIYPNSCIQPSVQKFVGIGNMMQNQIRQECWEACWKADDNIQRRDEQK